jgi:hypothetical protein
MRADKIVLWIANDDLEVLPDKVKAFQAFSGVEILGCEDLGPFKKLLPALERFPQAFVVTADDDLFYRRDWLETLVVGYDGRSITCLWGTPVRGGKPDWHALAANGPPTNAVIPGSGAGTLFPPCRLHPMVTDAQFSVLCPSGDDLWYYHMALKAGSKIRKVGRFRLIHWPGTQQSGLFQRNWLAGENEAMFCRLQEALPLHPALSTRR